MEQIRRIMRPTDVPDTGTLFLLVHDTEAPAQHRLAECSNAAPFRPAV